MGWDGMDGGTRRVRVYRKDKKGKEEEKIRKGEVSVVVFFWT